MTQAISYHWVDQETPISKEWVCYARIIEDNRPAWRYKGTVRRVPRFFPDFQYAYVAGTEDGMITEHRTLDEAARAVEASDAFDSVQTAEPTGLTPNPVSTDP